MDYGKHVVGSCGRCGVLDRVNNARCCRRLDAHRAIATMPTRTLIV